MRACLRSYGTLSDYSSNRAIYGALSPLQERKLRQLSFVSLGARHKRISYGATLCAHACCGPDVRRADMLKEALQIFDVRELEDLLLDTFYAGLVIGKIDAFAETVCVDFTIGRDVREVPTQPATRKLRFSLTHTFCAGRAAPNCGRA